MPGTVETGGRSYTWVKNQLQAAPWPGMLLHQDGSRHEWVPGQMWDLIVTMDDATNEHYSMFFCEEEGTWSSFRGGAGGASQAGGVLFTVHGSRQSLLAHAGGGGQGGQAHPDPIRAGDGPTVGIEMIPAYSPEARGRSERAFRTQQDRLGKELAAAGTTDMARANAYLRHHDLPAFNAEFARPSREAGSAFVVCPDSGRRDEILCEHHERRVGPDNCVRFQGRGLQIPPDRYRCHYVKANVTVLHHPDGWLAIRHGPRELARYDVSGKPLKEDRKAAA